MRRFANVVRDGDVINADSDSPTVQGVRRFLERLAAEPRVTATAICGSSTGAKASSAAEMVLPEGALSTATPREVAADFDARRAPSA